MKVHCVDPKTENTPEPTKTYCKREILSFNCKNDFYFADREHWHFLLTRDVSFMDELKFDYPSNLIDTDPESLEEELLDIGKEGYCMQCAKAEIKDSFTYKEYQKEERRKEKIQAKKRFERHQKMLP